MTVQAHAVLRALHDAPEPWVYGMQLLAATGLKSGTLYPLLDRLEMDHLVTSAWEEIDESAAGRRKRRYYSLTATGRAAITAAEHVQTVLSIPGWDAAGSKAGVR
jgi:DNA-binding PadR family transcriptional regulator